MDGVAKQPHLLLGEDDVHPIAIVVGDPARLDAIAALCQESQEVTRNREYRTMSCRFNDQWITVTSHGIGSAGAAICFFELCKVGVRVIIRAGTAGSLQPETLKPGDLCVCHSAVSADGVSRSLVPAGYPAVADWRTFNALMTEASKVKEDYYAMFDDENVMNPLKVIDGMGATCDLFYVGGILPSPTELYALSKVDIVEMEVATLFNVARINNVRAAAVCMVDGSPLDRERESRRSSQTVDEAAVAAAENYQPEADRCKQAKEIMLLLVLRTAAKMLREKSYL